MTGPEHYRAAEELVRWVEEAPLLEGVTVDDAAEANIIARAQVHATLAHAAASALRGPDEYTAWKAAAGTPQP